MYSGHGRLCVCLSLTAFARYCMDLDVSWGNGKGAVSLCSAGIGQICNRCTGFVDNIAQNAKCQPVLVLDLCLVWLLQTCKYWPCLRVLTSESVRKGSNAPSTRSLMVDEERLRSDHWLGSVLCVLSVLHQC